MRQAIKRIGIALGAAVVIFGLVLAYIAATFDPNDYKTDIVQAVRQKTGRTLQLQGDIGLSIFPTLGARLGQVSLSEPGSEREFASLQEAFVAVKLLPLLAREVIVEAIKVKGLRVLVRREKSGKFNFDDLAGGDEQKTDKEPKPRAMKVDIDHIRISDGDVTFSDQAAGTQHRLAKLNLKTGRVAEGVATPLELSTSITSSKGKAQLDTSLKGKLTFDTARRTFSLEGLDFSAKGAFVAAIAGSARVDLARESARLDFSGKLDESNVSGNAGVTAFSPLAVTFDLTADQVDVDRLLGRKPAKMKAGAKPAGDKGGPGGKDDKIDLSALKGLNAAGAVRIGKLTAFNVKSAQVRADIKIANGRLDAAPVTAQLYQGTLNGALSAQAADNAVFAIKQNLSRVSVGPLLRDAAAIDTLEGKGDISFDLTARGATVDALKKALSGTGAINLTDGAIKGMDIGGTIRSARTRLQELRGEQVQQHDKAQKTDFSELTATFTVKNGVAHNRDLSMKSPLLRLAGAGEIDIGNDRLNYLLKTTLVATSRGQGGRDAADLIGVTIPVRLTGALGAPQWSIDYSGLVAGLARLKVQDEILKRIPGQAPAGKGAKDSGGVQEHIKDRLKGLFGR